MRLPEIRYPLFWILGGCFLLVVGSVAWPLSEPLRGRVSNAWRRAIDGPPVPSSTEPRVVGGAITRRVLILNEKTPVTDRPGGQVVQEISRRNFADVYDVWPLDDEADPTSYRIGNRRPFGWVEARAVLPWNTRLIVRAAGATLELAETPSGTPTSVEVEPGSTYPVLAWDDSAVMVAVWAPGAPWQAVARLGWLRLADQPEVTPGVLLSRYELFSLWRGFADATTSEHRDDLRLRAILGRLTDREMIPAQVRDATRDLLPEWSRSAGPTPADDASVQLSRLYESWEPDASWSGLGFRSIPLDALP